MNEIEYGTVQDAINQAMQNQPNAMMLHGLVEEDMNGASAPEGVALQPDIVENQVLQNGAVPNEDEQKVAIQNIPVQNGPATMAIPVQNGPSETFHPFHRGSPETVNAISRVNGRGMWRSWKRNFKSSLMAVLDLFDNAIDASLVTTEESIYFKGRGKIHVMADKIPGGTTTGICMINNCHSRIPPMKEVLEIFRSNKGSQDIGENGVGIKQACASLTDISFVITRNGKDLNVGVIAAMLQRDEGCVLPFISLNSDMDTQDLSDCVTENMEFAKCVEIYGDGSLSKGLERLWDRCTTVCKNFWATDKYVFCVLLHKLRHGTETVNEASNSDDDAALDYALSAESLMDKLADALPERYIHIPADFDIRVNHQKIRFQYWERRLAELTSFGCKIDPKRDWSYAPDWQNPANGYSLRIYCGFDPRRSTSVLSLYVYSRHSGRLISYEEDARNTLGLTNSGTQFAQGLTIVLDDYMSRLPLTPTKQGLGFAEETTDGVHEKNLYAWLGAHAHAYYSYHLDRFGLKGALKDGVAGCLNQIQRLQDKDDVESFMRGKFTEFHGLTWSNYKSQSIRRLSKNFQVIKGPDSRVNLIPPAVPVSTRKKRKSSDSYRASPSPHTPALAMANGPTHQLMASASTPVMTTGRPPVADAQDSFPVTQDDDFASPAFNDVESPVGARTSPPEFHVPRKRPREGNSPSSQSATPTQGHQTIEEMEKKVQKYRGMYEHLHEKFSAAKTKYKEKLGGLKDALAARDETIRKKDEALEQIEYELNLKREDLSLAEEMKANLKQDVATLERQNATLAARLEGRRSTGTNIHI